MLWTGYFGRQTPVACVHLIYMLRINAFATFCLHYDHHVNTKHNLIAVLFPTKMYGIYSYCLHFYVVNIIIIL